MATCRRPVLASWISKLVSSKISPTRFPSSTKSIPVEAERCHARLHPAEATSIARNHQVQPGYYQAPLKSFEAGSGAPDRFDLGQHMAPRFTKPSPYSYLLPSSASGTLPLSSTALGSAPPSGAQPMIYGLKSTLSSGSMTWSILRIWMR